MSISSNGLNNYELSIGQFGAVKCYLFQGRLSNDLLLNPITDPCHESQWTEDLSPNPCFSLHFSISVWPWTSYLNCNLDSTFLTWTQLNGSKQILNYELEYATNKGPWDSSAGQSAWHQAWWPQFDPWDPMMEEDNLNLQVVLWPPLALSGICVLHLHTHKIR